MAKSKSIGSISDEEIVSFKNIYLEKKRLITQTLSDSLTMKAPHMKNSSSSTTHSSHRINLISNQINAQSYLEIGVAHGATFFDVNVGDKTAVDPNFKFDFASYESEKCHFIQETSDNFFVHQTSDKTFDIIFIDGLHTFEQTLRDFLSSLAHGHSKSVWIIDDVLPNDIFSSLPSQSDAYKFRSLLGNSANTSWHGDVYKLVFFIHDFFPEFSFSTLNSHGNPQTIIWREPRSNFKPIFNNLELISRLSFFDLHRHIQVFNIMTEDDFSAMLERFPKIR